MSKVLDNLKPGRVFHFFEEICSIPHGSGNVKAISDYCVEFAKQRGLEVIQDDAYNVIIKKTASKGKENSPVVALQGHLDMVCEKNADINFDFEKDGLNLAIDGDWIHANGTTLGGDDGIAVAFGLAILEDDSLVHPPLEVIFTTDEETGMDGAQALNPEYISAKYLINVDSEEEGVITVGCAGGLKSEASFEIENMDFEGVEYELCVSGLKGGHSGVEIHIGRANANKLMGRLLFALRKEMVFGLIDVYGGAKDNAIARDAKAGIVIEEENTALAEEIIARVAREICDQYRVVDPQIQISFVKKDAYNDQVMTFSTAEKVVYMLFNTPYGVQTMSGDVPGLVESSLNLGVVRTEMDQVSMTWALRSSVKALKWHMNDQLEYMSALLGGDYHWHGSYPEWEYRPDSKLRLVATQIYEYMYGKKPVISVIHAGLECGLFSEKMPDMDMISIGPNMMDIHTPKERLSISSTARVYEYVCRILASF